MNLTQLLWQSVTFINLDLMINQWHLVLAMLGKWCPILYDMRKHDNRIKAKTTKKYAGRDKGHHKDLVKQRVKVDKKQQATAPNLSMANSPHQFLDNRIIPKGQ